MRHISILGSTGSIGTQTLDVVREHGDIKVSALSCGRNIKLLEKQAREFKPSLVSVWDKNDAEELRVKLADTDIKVSYGMEGLIESATIEDADMIVTAIVGMLGIRPTIAAIKAKKAIALANKETLVTAGHIIIPLAKEYGVPILPVDSEHSAIFQSLQGNKHNKISKILLTASAVQREGRLARDIRKSRANTGYIFQQFNLVNRLSVLENVLIGALGSTPFWRTCFSWFTREQKQRALQALTRVGMVH